MSRSSLWAFRGNIDNVFRRYLERFAIECRLCYDEHHVCQVCPHRNVFVVKAFYVMENFWSGLLIPKMAANVASRLILSALVMFFMLLFFNFFIRD